MKIEGARCVLSCGPLIFFPCVWFPRWQDLVIASKVWEEDAGSNQSISPPPSLHSTALALFPTLPPSFPLSPPPSNSPSPLSVLETELRVLHILGKDLPWS